MQNDAANELHIEVTHTQCATPRFAHGGKSFRKQFVEGGPSGQTASELLGLCQKRRIVQRFVLFLEPVNTEHRFANAFELSIISSAKEFF